MANETNTLQLPDNTTEILEKVANNLNIGDTDPGSYLNTVTDGLYDYARDITNKANSTIANMFLETADEYEIEAYGARLNIPRIKSQEISVRAKDGRVSIEPTLFRDSANIDIPLYSKGEQVVVDYYTVTFLEDVVFNTNLSKMFVSCNFAYTEGYDIPYAELTEGKSFNIPLPVNVRPLVREIVMNIETTLHLSSDVEQLDIYRQRLKYYVQSKNIVGKDAVRNSIFSIPYVDQIYINDLVYPNQVYLLSGYMYRDDMYSDIIDRYALNLVESTVNKMKGYTSSFEFQSAKRITYVVDIITDKTIDINLLNAMFPFLYANHKLGSITYINKALFQNALNISGYTGDFEINLYMFYGGLRVLAEDPEQIIIQPEEYPFCIGITCNGDYSNV